MPEIEAINIDALFDAEKLGVTVIPNAEAVNKTMNRKNIREYVSKELNIKTSKYRFVASFKELLIAGRELWISLRHKNPINGVRFLGHPGQEWLAKNPFRGFWERLLWEKKPAKKGPKRGKFPTKGSLYIRFAKRRVPKEFFGLLENFPHFFKPPIQGGQSWEKPLICGGKPPFWAPNFSTEENVGDFINCSFAGEPPLGDYSPAKSASF